MAASAGSRRAWGWHPLADDWAGRIVEDAGVRPGQLVLDIGAGRGALTAHLVAAGAQVIAVEPHPGRARWLRERFAGARVTVVESDVLALRLPHRPLPRRAFQPPPPVDSAVLVVRRRDRVRAPLAGDRLRLMTSQQEGELGEGETSRAR